MGGPEHREPQPGNLVGGAVHRGSPGHASQPVLVRPQKIATPPRESTKKWGQGVTSPLPWQPPMPRWCGHVD